MNQRQNRPLFRQNMLRFALVALVAALVLALAWWRPWQASLPAQPLPVALVPTPTTPATSTATSAPNPVVPPVGTPTRPVTPAVTPAIAASPAQAEPRAPGTILYTGFIAGRHGIVSAIADGSDHALLVEGAYGEVSWRPGGDRFAAVSPLGDELAQLAIFDQDGRPLARYPFEGTVTNLLWSPDGSRLACLVFRRGANPTTEVWLITSWGEPLRITIPEANNLHPLGWTPFGSLYVTSNDTQGFSSSLWLVNPDGINSTRITGGNFFPLGLADDGETLLAVVVVPTVRSGGGTAQPTINEIVAINLRSDQRRLLAAANALGQRVFGDAAGSIAYQFVNGRSTPDGNHLALVVAPQAPTGTPRPSVARDTTALVFVRLDGTITGTLTLADGDRGGTISWSPNGKFVAFFSLGGATGEYVMRIIDTTGAQRGSYRVNATASQSPYAGHIAVWSPDSQWLVYNAPTGLVVVSAIGDPPYPLNAQGVYVAWRPR